jgi:hypothetical protein
MEKTKMATQFKAFLSEYGITQRALKDATGLAPYTMCEMVNNGIASKKSIKLVSYALVYDFGLKGITEEKISSLLEMD